MENVLRVGALLTGQATEYKMREIYGMVYTLHGANREDNGNIHLFKLDTVSGYPCSGGYLFLCLTGIWWILLL